MLKKTVYVRFCWSFSIKDLTHCKKTSFALSLFDTLGVQDDPDIANQRIQPYIEQCTSHHLLYWLLALYSYKGLLLLFGTFLAWETRKVRLDECIISF